MHKLCISIVPIFNHLDASEMNEIVKTAHSLTHQRGQTIFRAGEPSQGMYIVHAVPVPRIGP
jgi:CRP/FNR family transcriptional regulator, anaerobic regulatory protein